MSLESIIEAAGYVIIAGTVLGFLYFMFSGPTARDDDDAF